MTDRDAPARPGPRTLPLLGLVVAVATVTALATAALAGHQFTDVGTGNFFHEPIESIADAGCATGYPGGQFRPDQDITRAQFALWLNRCGGRVAFESETKAGVGGTEVDVGVNPALTIGGDPVGGGFLVVLTSVEATGATGCTGPCTVRFKLFRGVSANPIEEADLTIDSGEAVSGSLSTAFPVAGGETTNIRLTAQVVEGGGTVSVEGSTTLLSTPFAGDGSGGGQE